MSDLIETYRGAVYPWHWLVRSAFLEVREKVARFVHEMCNAQTGEVSAICVLTGVSMDSQTRKSCPFPQDMVARAQSLVRAYAVPA
jgi:acyl-CoA thioester hydrolase